MKAVFIGRLKWDVSVLLLGVSQLLVSQSLQILANDQTSVAGFNDAIDEASGSSSEGIGKPKEVSLGQTSRSKRLTAPCTQPRAP